MIDRIDGLGSIRSPQTVKRTAKAGSAGESSFAKQIDDSGETSATNAVMGTSAVAGILGVQEVDDALARRSRSKMRAQNILDRLEELRIQLLSGGLSRDKLFELSRMVNARREQINDPQLMALLDDIELRAQVELATYAP